MDVKGMTPILNVSDLAESFAWFEKLGWRKLWSWGDPPDFGAVRCGSNEIFLCKDGQGIRGPLTNEPWAESGTWMSWWVESPEAVDRAYAEAIRNGITAPLPPEDMPWNVRECHIRHPDGHTFRVSAGLKEE